MAETLTRKQIENDAAREGAYRFLTTGDVDGVPRDGRAASSSSRSKTSSRSRSRPSRRRPHEPRRRTPRRRLRALELIPDWLENAHGSVLYSQGKTRVLCTAMVEERRAALAPSLGTGLDDRGVLAPPGLDGRAGGPRGGEGQAGRAHGRDPTADRTGAPLGVRLQRARRAHALARLRRAPGRRRHALRCDLGRLRGRPSRARPLRALEGARGPDRGRLGRRRRRHAGARPRLLRGLAPPRPT